jgi:predicted amidohydrolase
MLTLAMIQMQVDFHQPEANLERAAQWVAKAAAEGAQLCILPECMDLGWGTPEAVRLAQPIPGAVSSRLCQIARENRVWLVSGLTEKAGGRVYNAALLISDTGEILLHHRKINVLTGVEDVYAIGDRLSVADTPFGRIGIDICADNAVQSLSVGHTLARMGAQMILSPCAWAVPPQREEGLPYGQEWHVPYGHLSSLYGIAVVGVSNVGQVPCGSWQGWKAIGNSIAYGPDGKPLAVLPYGEDAQFMRLIRFEPRAAEQQGTALADRVYRQLGSPLDAGEQSR